MSKYHIDRETVNARRKGEKATPTKDGNGFRKASVRLKTARGRKNSSQRWLQRQLNDPYVQQAQQEGLRSRAAYKLLEIDRKFDLVRPGMTIVDLGAAPGGWCQIALKILQDKSNGKKSFDQIVAIDILEMDPIADVKIMQGDFLNEEVRHEFKKLAGDRVDVVLSDMAASTTGHGATDHWRTMALAETAFDFAQAHLKERGNFVTKVFAGGTHGDLLTKLKKSFEKVRHFKPPASRSESPETYVVCLGFRQSNDEAN